MTFRVPICVHCRHFRGNDLGGNFCAAFPDGDGIPAAIFEEGAPHFSPIPGDHGVQFEPVDDHAEQIVERRFGRRRAAAGASVP
jgi:hypothetical protein